MIGRAPAAALPRLRAHLRAPLHRNAYALVLSSGLTSALGLLYWIIAARLFSPAAIGVSAALIAAMTLIANLAQLNLKGALNRFLPRAGAASPRFVRDAYLVAAVLAAAAAAVFLAGVRLWTPALGFLADRPELAVAFLLATVAWSIFVLQDAVLAGIREAVWVPVENGVYAVAKIAALLVVAGSMPVLGVFVSWIIPLVAVIVPVNVLIFRRLLPRHVARVGTAQEPPRPREVARYVAADYTAYLVWAGTVDLLPLIVLGLFGAAANAHFYLAWTIAYGLYLVSSGMGVSLVTEGALDPDRLAEHRRRTMRESARIVVPAALAVALGAPLILRLLGQSYAEEAVTLLVTLSLSAIPFVVVAAHANAARVERRMGRVVAIYGGLAAGVLGVGLSLAPALGVDAFGVAWLVAQTGAAAVLTGAAPLAAAGAVLRQRRHGAAGARRTLNEMRTRALPPTAGAPARYEKRSRGPLGARALRREARVLRALHADPRLGEWSLRAPRVLAMTAGGARVRLLETAVPGIPIDRLPPERREAALAAAARAAGALHDATAATVRVGPPELGRWVDRPLSVVRAALRDPASLRAADALGEELRTALAGLEVRAAWTHGDLSPGNVLVGPAGVSGLVDWEAARPRALPELDLVQLELSARRLATGAELGELVRRALRGEDAPPAWSAPADGRVPRRVLVLLAWLHHVAGNLGKSRRYAGSRRWRVRNVEAVLAAVAAPAGASTAPGPRPVATAPAAPPPAATVPRSPAIARRRVAALSRGPAVPLGALAAAMALWAWALGAIEPREMSRLGLLSVLPPAWYAALALLVAGFAITVSRRHVSGPLAAALVTGLVALLHATPVLAYETLRYSWAWKHLGIVDYIQRRGGVTPDIAYLDVYHNWPGFFVLAAVLAGLAGIGDLSAVAAWAPVAFNLLSAAALAVIVSSLTRDRRILWLTLWLFLLANWFGQDYFAPQALAFTLYLAALAVALRLLDPAGAVRGGRRLRLPARLGPLDERPPGPAGLPRAGRLAAVAAVLALVAAIVVSHALTSVMIAVALAALVLVRRCAPRGLPVAAAALVLLWGLTFASDFVFANLGSAIGSVRLPWVAAEANLSAPVELGRDQIVTATVGRLMVIAAAVLAVVGIARQAYRGRVESAALALAAAPVAIFALGDYDGEVLFRVCLFSTPFLAFFAAHAMPGLGGGALRRGAGVAAVSVVLAAGFLVAAYGNDRTYYFTPDEVAATRWLYGTAPEGALIIDGTRNYPAQWSGYERYRYVTISREDPDSRARLLADPAAVLERWMSDSRDAAAYLVITRGQREEEAAFGALPQGSLARIEAALTASPRFRVAFRNPDAVIFARPEPA